MLQAYSTAGAVASSRDTLRADPDLRAYRPCHMRDGTAGDSELIVICTCYHRRASPLSVTSTGRAERPEDGPRSRRRRYPRGSHESVAGRMEQLADVGRSEPAASGLDD